MKLFSTTLKHGFENYLRIKCWWEHHYRKLCISINAVQQQQKTQKADQNCFMSAYAQVHTPLSLSNRALHTQSDSNIQSEFESEQVFRDFFVIFGKFGIEQILNILSIPNIRKPLFLTKKQGFLTQTDFQIFFAKYSRFWKKQVFPKNFRASKIPKLAKIKNLENSVFRKTLLSNSLSHSSLTHTCTYLHTFAHAYTHLHTLTQAHTQIIYSVRRTIFLCLSHISANLIQ